MHVTLLLRVLNLGMQRAVGSQCLFDIHVTCMYMYIKICVVCIFLYTKKRNDHLPFHHLLSHRGCWKRTPAKTSEWPVIF